MASIININGKWRALIRRKGHKSISKWFDTKAKAKVWADEIEAQVVSGRPVVAGKTISAYIKEYRRLREITRPISDSSTEHYTLKMLDRMLGQEIDLTPDKLLGWAQQRRDEGAGPYTVNCDLSKLGTVLRQTSPSLLPQLDAVRPKLSYLGLIGGGGRRERRPTEEETQLILGWLEQHKGLRYRDFAAFAVLTAMRRGEVARLRWADLDRENKMVLVRDRKDPRQKVGNDQWVPLLYGSFDIVLSQPQEGELIFPIHPQTISKYFKECCVALGIPDLHLHDLRHDGISKMFESGFDIPHVAVVSGHRDWKNLKRYTHIKPESLQHHAAHQDKTQRLGSQPTAASRQDKS